jgi:hypothetical protein
MALADDIKSAIAGLADSLPEAAFPAVYSHRAKSGIVESRTVSVALVKSAPDPLSEMSPEAERTDGTAYLSAADWTWPDKPLVGDTIRHGNETYSVASVATMAGVAWKLAVKEVAQ